ncbi:MAG: 4Fe-4S dicluster domain-containing protein [Verrucomicrobiae bacterium]|nr:4Fe-4S dicluster domain-containing protein [Verrucomicrobiae bacterium]
MNAPPSSTPTAFLDPQRAAACVHCGLCLSACPTYLETGNENDSPRGRIHLMRALAAGRLAPNGAAVRHLDLCLGCRACEPACPSGVAYGHLLEATRDHLDRVHRRHPVQTFLRRVLIGRILPHPRRLAIALLPARFARAAHLEPLLPASARAWLDLLPFPLEPALAAPPLPEVSPASASPRLGRVALLTGCVMHALFRNTHHQTVRLLNAAGYDVLIPPNQTCCGALHAHGGQLDTARAAARHNLEAFPVAELDAIVVNAAGCGSTLKDYGSLLAGDPDNAGAAHAFAQRVRDLTEWLAATPGFPEQLARLGQHLPGTDRIACHDACHLAHAQGITEAPRRLIRAAAGNRYVELPETDLCCGSAGSYSLTEPAMSRRLRDRKVRHLASLGSVTVVTTNPGCHMQLQAGLREARLRTSRVVHIADWLGDLLPP